MNENNLLGVPISHTSISNHKLTYDQKKAKDWGWLKEWIDFYANSYHGLSQEEIDKIYLNYRLYNSRGVYKTDISSPMYSKELEEEGYYFTGEDIPHFDILTPIVKSQYGQQQLMPFKPIVTDSSFNNVNFRKKKRVELYQEYINSTVVDPVKQQAVQEWLLENQIEDLNQIPPDLQEAAQAQIDEKSSAMLPEDVDRWMASDYKSPRETQLQQITEFTIRRDKLKFWTDENFKHMLISGGQYYETGIRHKKAFTRILNPVGYSSGGPAECMFEEDMDWQMYEEQISLATLFRDHGHEITEADLKKLRDFDPSTSTRVRGEFPEPMATKLAEFDAETGIFDYAPKNLKTREGQSFLLALQTKFSNLNSTDTLFTRRTVAFKSLRKFKLVTRYNEETGQQDQFWVDGAYTKNPKKDIRVESHWFPHAYMGRRVEFGSAENYLYFDLGPVPNQYKNVLEPWNITMPFMGAKYSKLFDNTENVAPMDLGKKWQDKFNIKLAFIQEKENTDIGRIFAIANSMKPKDWSFQKWLTMAKYGKVLPLETDGDLNGIDTQIFKTFDLRQIDEIASHLQHLDWIRQQAALAMNYNPQRLGQIVPTEAVRNSQQNIQQSTYQTQDLFTLHNEIVERVLNRHINNERIALMDNSFVASYVLDDMSIAELNTEKELLDGAEVGIILRNSSEDFNNLREIKMDSQAMIQTGMITFPEYIRLKMANNMADALNIAERAEKKMLQRQAEQQQAQAEQAKQLEDIRAQLERDRQEREDARMQANLESQEYREKIRATTMANQMDIDKDGRSDLIQIKEMDSTEKAKDREHDEKLQDKKLKVDLEKERIKARNKPKPTSN